MRTRLLDSREQQLQVDAGISTPVPILAQSEGAPSTSRDERSAARYYGTPGAVPPVTRLGFSISLKRLRIASIEFQGQN